MMDDPLTKQVVGRFLLLPCLATVRVITLRIRIRVGRVERFMPLPIIRVSTHLHALGRHAARDVAGIAAGLGEIKLCRLLCQLVCDRKD